METSASVEATTCTGLGHPTPATTTMEHEHIETAPATSMAHIASPADPATSDTPVNDIWYIVIDNENTPLGQPIPLYDVAGFTVHQLLVEIKSGPYQAKLEDVNIMDLEVWECPTLSLEGHGRYDVEGLMKSLTLSRGSDSNRDIGGWEPVVHLHLQKYQPLVIRVTL